ATLIPIQVHPQDDGSVGVTASGYHIADGVVSVPLEIRTSGGTVGLAIQGRPGMLPDLGGSVGGMLEVLNQDIPAIRATLDELANALVTEVNAIHVTGTNPLGGTGIDFFDPAGLTADTIALSAEVAADADAIAAGTPDGLGGYRAGANDVALSLAALRDVSIGSLGKTLGGHFRGLVSDVGSAVRSSQDAVGVHRALAEQADIRRMSISGVSIDEELVSMIQYQTAYQAAAKVVTAVDEMLQSLINM
ncbi:MAG: hypothetical protein OEZ37_09800, partial [Gemmatimonadota bacterium]|nr:hypothetical protein [Gemmatimonadota bacterium]